MEETNLDEVIVVTNKVNSLNRKDKVNEGNEEDEREEVEDEEEKEEVEEAVDEDEVEVGETGELDDGSDEAIQADDEADGYGEDDETLTDTSSEKKRKMKKTEPRDVAKIRNNHVVIPLKAPIRRKKKGIYLRLQSAPPIDEHEKCCTKDTCKSALGVFIIIAFAVGGYLLLTVDGPVSRVFWTMIAELSKLAEWKAEENPEYIPDEKVTTPAPVTKPPETGSTVKRTQPPPTPRAPPFQVVPMAFCDDWMRSVDEESWRSLNKSIVEATTDQDKLQAAQTKPYFQLHLAMKMNRLSESDDSPGCLLWQWLLNKDALERTKMPFICKRPVSGEIPGDEEYRQKYIIPNWLEDVSTPSSVV